MPDALVEWAEREPSFGTWSRVTRRVLLDVDRPSRTEERVRRSGLATRTDARGRAVLSVGSGALDVVARSADRWGTQSLGTGWRGTCDAWDLACADYSAERSELSVAVFEDRAVDVEVVDSRGRPVDGAPVRVLAQTWWSGERPEELVTGSTHEGVAHLTHFEAARAARTSIEAPANDDAWVEIGGLHGASTRVALRAPPESTRLVLPPCGAVEIELVDTAGRPVTPEVPLAIEVFGRGQMTRAEAQTTANANGVSLFFHDGLDDPTPDAALPFASAVDGRAVFHHVPLGVNLTVRIQRNGASQAVLHTFRGPLVEGERVRTRAEVGAGCATFSMRAVGPDERPFADVALAAMVHRGDRSVVIRSGFHPSPMSVEPDYAALTTLRTDSDGRIAIDLPSDWSKAHDEDWGLGPAQLIIECETGSATAAGARVELASRWPERAVDLGDVKLVPAPVLVSGTVVDSAGSPLTGAHVATRLSSSFPVLVARSDRDGRFEFRSWARVSSGWLAVRRAGYLGDADERYSERSTATVLRMTRER